MRGCRVCGQRLLYQGGDPGRCERAGKLLMQRGGDGQYHVVQAEPDQFLRVRDDRVSVRGPVAVSLRVSDAGQVGSVQGAQDAGVVTADSSQADDAGPQRPGGHAARSRPPAIAVMAVMTWSS